MWLLEGERERDELSDNATHLKFLASHQAERSKKNESSVTRTSEVPRYPKLRHVFCIYYHMLIATYFVSFVVIILRCYLVSIRGW